MVTECSIALVCPGLSIRHPISMDIPQVVLPADFLLPLHFYPPLKSNNMNSWMSWPILRLDLSVLSKTP